jgi:hypothetical protein
VCWHCGSAAIELGENAIKRTPMGEFNRDHVQALA